MVARYQQVGTTHAFSPLNPRRAHKSTRERAILEARGTTPLNPRRAHKNTRERAR
jgi:hypothetical protein